MKLLRSSLAALVVSVLVSGTTWAESFPRPVGPPENFEELIPTITNATPNPLRLSTSNVPYNGSGDVNIPFTLNQRATVWIAIYEVGSSETGPSGPNGAVVRAQPQAKFVAVAPVSGGAVFQAGNNSARWDGRDWNGQPAGAGNYEFDVIGINNLDQAALVGPSAANPPDPIFDLRSNEIWVHATGGQPSPDRGQFWGTMWRGTLGTDYLANPTGYETWNFEESLQMIETATSTGGIRPDAADPTSFYISTWTGEPANGVYRMKRNDSAKTFDRDPSFGDNGFSVLPLPAGERAMQLSIWKDKLYTANWSTQEVPAPSFSVWDKGTGEFLQNVDQHREFFYQFNVDENGNESFGAGGPTYVAINETGLWVVGWRGTSMIKLDHDFNLIWANGPGDRFGDQISVERAAQLGLTGDAAEGGFSLVIKMIPEAGGRLAFGSPLANAQGVYRFIVGRDGAGIIKLFMDPQIGPFRLIADRNTAILQNNCSAQGGDLYCAPNRGPGPYDGLIFDTRYDLQTHSYRSFEASDPRTPAMAMHVPFDIQTGRMGANVTAVEEVEGAGTPDSYSLGAAYPNPFNPETAIDFAVPADSHVKIDLFNAAGQLVDTLVDNFKTAGAYKATWNARGFNGQRVSSGVYFYRMQAADFSATHSMTLLK